MEKKIKNIICVTDFSEFSEYSVYYGVELAKKFGAKFYLGYVIHIPHNAIYSISVSDSQARQTQLLEHVRRQAERLLRHQSVNCEPFFTVTSSADEIVRISKEKKADLVVFASQPQLGLKRFLLGSITDRLMQTLPLPLLLICGPRGNYETSWKENINFQRILVECDFSPDSIIGLRYALGIAQHFHSEVNITLVCKPGDCRDLIGATAESKKELPQNLQNQINAKLTNLFPQGTLTSCRINTEFLAGRPGEDVIKYAKANKVNLIVLRTRIRGLADRPVKNHIANFVYCRSTCPILLVRPKT